jgi:MFS family permease
MAFAFSLSEGTVSNWMPMAVVDGFGKTEATGALLYSMFLVAITVVRWAGVPLIDRFGRVRTLRVSATICMAGLVLFALAPTFWLAAVGAIVWGLGAALNWPIALSAAADDPLKSAGRVSVVSAFGSGAQLVAPPLIGMVGGSIGLRHAFLGICFFLAISMIVSPAVRHKPRRR